MGNITFSCLSTPSVPILFSSKIITCPLDFYSIPLFLYPGNFSWSWSSLERFRLISFKRFHLRFEISYSESSYFMLSNYSLCIIGLCSFSMSNFLWRGATNFRALSVMRCYRCWQSYNFFMKPLLHFWAIDFSAAIGPFRIHILGLFYWERLRSQHYRDLYWSWSSHELWIDSRACPKPTLSPCSMEAIPFSWLTSWECSLFPSLSFIFATADIGSPISTNLSIGQARRLFGPFPTFEWPACFWYSSSLSRSLAYLLFRQCRQMKDLRKQPSKPLMFL